jgi:hypothetical protein
MSLEGVVRNGVVVLGPEMNLPEGTKVSVRLVGPLSESLRRSAKEDPNFERAIAAFAEAEAKEQDPLEGEPVDLATNPAAREELRKILRGG